MSLTSLPIYIFNSQFLYRSLIISSLIHFLAAFPLSTPVFLRILDYNHFFSLHILPKKYDPHTQLQLPPACQGLSKSTCLFAFLSYGLQILARLMSSRNTTDLKLRSPPCLPTALFPTHHLPSLVHAASISLVTQARVPPKSHPD